MRLLMILFLLPLTASGAWVNQTFTGENPSLATRTVSGQETTIIAYAVDNILTVATSTNGAAAAPESVFLHVSQPAKIYASVSRNGIPLVVYLVGSRIYYAAKIPSSPLGNCGPSATWICGEHPSVPSTPNSVAGMVYHHPTAGALIHVLHSRPGAGVFHTFQKVKPQSSHPQPLWTRIRQVTSVAATIRDLDIDRGSGPTGEGPGSQSLGFIINAVVSRGASEAGLFLYTPGISAGTEQLNLIEHEHYPAWTLRFMGAVGIPDLSSTHPGTYFCTQSTTGISMLVGDAAAGAWLNPIPVTSENGIYGCRIDNDPLNFKPPSIVYKAGFGAVRLARRTSAAPGWVFETLWPSLALEADLKYGASSKLRVLFSHLGGTFTYGREY